jgi:hypothetical protein
VAHSRGAAKPWAETSFSALNGVKAFPQLLYDEAVHSTGVFFQRKRQPAQLWKYRGNCENALA